MMVDAIRLMVFPALMAFAASSDFLTMTISNKVSLALVAGFVWHALRTEDPLLDGRLFAQRGFGSAAATNFLLGVALFGVALLLPRDPMFPLTSRRDSNVGEDLRNG